MNATQLCLPAPPGDLRHDLLRWYDRHRRSLPWRAPPGEVSDPYRVWLSEIMLQQTTVAAAINYFCAFVARWPNVEALAAADLDQILVMWQGLGYYARARNLHACAKAVVRDHGGRFPATEVGLRALPGVGEYTAAAIAAIAFNRPTVPVDGNVVRVTTRLTAIETPLPAARDPVARLSSAFADHEPERGRPGDLAQALMDLGATVCTPRRPKCLTCPWHGPCRARATGEPERFPVKPEKPEKPRRHGVAFWLTRPDGTVLLRRRPEHGLLGGMMEVPTTPWQAETWTVAKAVRAAAPCPARWQRLPETVGHTFTHFHLSLDVLAAQIREGATTDGLWWPVARLGEQALPTVMKKVVRIGRGHTGGAA